MSKENPAYENFDLEIKNEDELKIAKIEAGVKSHEEVLRDALVEGVKKGDQLLVDNAIKGLKDVGAAEYAIKSKQKEAGIGKENIISGEDKEELAEISADLSGGNENEKERLYKRALLLYRTENSVEKVEERLKFEQRIARSGRGKSRAYIENRGMIEKVLSDDFRVTDLLEREG